MNQNPTLLILGALSLGVMGEPASKFGCRKASPTVRVKLYLCLSQFPTEGTLQAHCIPVMDSHKTENHPNGEIIIGDTEYDGRVILYVIKGKLTPFRVRG